MTSCPIVSVVVPCYNQAQYLEECIESVLSQTYPHWEAIIVNDGSTDHTELVAYALLERDARIRYYSKQNEGVSVARNYAISKSTGHYILPLDADDKIHEDYLQRIVSVFLAAPDTRLVYSDLMFFGAKSGLWDMGSYAFDLLLYKNCVHASGCYKREDYDRTDGYRPNMVYGIEDWDFWIQLLDREAKVVKIDAPLFYYRIKEASRSTGLSDSASLDKTRLMKDQILRNNLDKYLSSMDMLNMVRDYYVYKDFFENSRYAKIRKVFDYVFR